jgi:hypothetical protein
MPKAKSYALREGMVLEKKYRRQTYRLSVIKEGGVMRFKISSKIFPSLTAAAKHIVGENQEISGPHFWHAPLSKS